MSNKYFAALLFTVVALAQTPPDPGSSTIEGTVFNSLTGAPLRRADLTLASGDVPPEIATMIQQYGSPATAVKISTRSIVTTTDAAGRFRFEKVTPGNYWLTAKKAGYGDERYKPKAAASSRGAIRLEPGQELKNIEFHLVPHGSASGRVLDEDGEAFPTATVSAYSYSFSKGPRRLVVADTAPANNRGEFSLSKLPPGHYFICADVQRSSLPGELVPPPADGSPETAYVTTYLPATIDPGQAQKVDIAPGGDVTGLNIRMRKSVVVRVKGQLTDEAGSPITTAQMMTMSAGRNASMFKTVVNNPEGRFELTDLLPGVYTVVTMEMQGATPKMGMHPLLVSSKGVDNLKLGARSDTAIRVKVTAEGDPEYPLKGFAVTLSPADNVLILPATGKADDAGAFTLPNLAPAVYDVVFPFIPNHAYLKSVEFNGRDVAGRPIDCSSLSTAELRIVLGTDVGKVEARVSRDDKPVVGATVVLVPADSNQYAPETVLHGSTGETGRVTLMDAAPGDYLAFAWESVEEGAWFDPDFLKTAQGKGVKVQVRSKTGEQVELKPIPAAAR